MTDTTIKTIAAVFPIDADALKLEIKSSQRRDIIKDFGLNTSTNGIPGIARSKSMHNCLFWSVSFIAFTGIMLYFVIESILAFYSYPTQTSVSITNVWPQRFPAVTICNYSPYRYDQFIGPYLNYTNALDLTNTTDKSSFSKQQALYISDFLVSKLNRNESLDEFYYPLNAMLIKCVYNGVDCSTADFVQFRSPTYGFCYTFNAQTHYINNGTVHYNNENGYSGELQLDLYVHSQQYVPYVTDAVGLVAMVHDNTELPLIEQLGIQLVAGRKHKLGYTLKTNAFLPSPYTACTKQVTSKMQAMFDQFSGAIYGYIQQICFNVALQGYTYDECGCVDPSKWTARYVIPLGTTNVTQAPLCNASDLCSSEAADRFQSLASVGNNYAADCTLQCDTNEFVLKISSNAAPTVWYMDDIKQFVESSSIPLSSNWNSTWSSEIQASYVSIDVVLQSALVESYTQQATLGVVDVISNVGGQSGLWIGISFLSLMEIAEMVYRLIRHQYHRFRGKIRQRMQNISTEL